eukprot:15479712-Alexandrium_andersonii.AAC.1
MNAATDQCKLPGSFFTRVMPDTPQAHAYHAAYHAYRASGADEAAEERRLNKRILFLKYACLSTLPK